MATATAGDKVSVHYKGSLDDGTVFDSSEGRDPLSFELGAGQVIAGFDETVDGMEVGESRTAHIPVDKAYGPKRDEMIAEVPRAQFPDSITPEVGQKLSMQAQGGQMIPVTVTAVADDTVTLDANHDLAGKDLNFEIELVEIG